MPKNKEEKYRHASMCERGAVQKGKGLSRLKAQGCAKNARKVHMRAKSQEAYKRAHYRKTPSSRICKAKMQEKYMLHARHMMQDA